MTVFCCLVGATLLVRLHHWLNRRRVGHQAVDYWHMLLLLELDYVLIAQAR